MKFEFICIAGGTYGVAAVLSGVVNRTIESIKEEGLTIRKGLKVLILGSAHMIVSLVAIVSAVTGFFELWETFGKDAEKEETEK